jgi:ABC-2 type transport system permease protein
MVPLVSQALAVDHATSTLAAAGLDPAEVASALAPPRVELDELQAGRGGQIAAAAIVSLGVYLLIFMLTAAVANAVAIEKANRVSEVLLAVMPSRALFFGKVIGIGLIGVVPFICGALPIVVKLVAGGSLPPGTAAVIAGGAAWFVLGAALYLLVAGALGALVERQEEVGSAMSILSILLVSSYVVGQSAADSPLGAALAYVPFSAPMVEPARLALGASSPAEVVISLATSLVAVIVAARFASTIYRKAIVRTGRRLHVRDVLRASPS